MIILLDPDVNDNSRGVGVLFYVSEIVLISVLSWITVKGDDDDKTPGGVEEEPDENLKINLANNGEIDENLLRYLGGDGHLDTFRKTNVYNSMVASSDFTESQHASSHAHGKAGRSPLMEVISSVRDTHALKTQMSKFYNDSNRSGSSRPFSSSSVGSKYALIVAKDGTIDF